MVLPFCSLAASLRQFFALLYSATFLYPCLLRNVQEGMVASQALLALHTVAGCECWGEQDHKWLRISGATCTSRYTFENPLGVEKHSNNSSSTCTTHSTSLAPCTAGPRGVTVGNGVAELVRECPVAPLPKDNHFVSYLTGLIEGDGTIIVPKTERSSKGKLNYPSIQIVFHLKDLPLALLIQKNLGTGSLIRKRGSNAYILFINDKKGILKLVSFLNGNMKTPKIYSLYKLIDWLNNKNLNLPVAKYTPLTASATEGIPQSTPPALFFACEASSDQKRRGAGAHTKGEVLQCIPKLPLNTEPLGNNAWLSGIIESDGHFSIRTTISSVPDKYSKIECKFELSQRQKDHLGYSNELFLANIANFLNVPLKNTRENTLHPQYRLRTASLETNLKLVNYLNEFPLFGSKYLDYKN